MIKKYTSLQSEWMYIYLYTKYAACLYTCEHTYMYYVYTFTMYMYMYTGMYMYYM